MLTTKRERLLDDQDDRIDAEIGARLRQARRVRSKTQTQVAEALGVSFQQVQKYERGANRLSGSTLVRACRFLEIPIHDLLPQTAGDDRIDWPSLIEDDAADLVRAFATVTDPGVRRAILAIAKASARS